MTAEQMIEVIKTADIVFTEKYGSPMEIFDFHFSEDDEDGGMVIEASHDVLYRSNHFEFGEKTGKHPVCKIVIHFECENEKIVDRSIELKEME